MTSDNQPAGMSPEEWASILYGDQADPAEVDAAIEAEEVGEVEDMGHASWHWRQANLAERTAEMYEAVFAAEIEKLKARLEEAAGPFRKREAWHRDAVQAWHRAAYAADPKGTPKTIKFADGGGSQLVRQQPIVAGEVDDEKLMAWLETQKTDDGRPWSDLVYKRKEPEFKISELTKLVSKPAGDPEPGEFVKFYNKDTGEEVPGIRLIAREQRWQRKS